MEEPGGLQFMGSQRIRHDWATSLSLFTFMHWRRKYSSVLAWRIPGMGEPGELPSLGSHRVGHDWSNLAAATAAIKQNICMISKQIPVNDTWWSLCLQTTGKTAWKDKSRIKLFFSSLSILNRYTQRASTETKGLWAVAWCAQRALDLN